MIGALKQLEAGRKAEDVAREVGVSKHTIYAWRDFIPASLRFSALNCDVLLVIFCSASSLPFRGDDPAFLVRECRLPSRDHPSTRPQVP